MRERLTATSDEEVVDDILQTFAARTKKDQAAAVVDKALRRLADSKPTEHEEATTA